MQNSTQDILITKQEFVDIIKRLQESSELVDKVEELFRNSRENVECDFCNGAGLQISHESIVIRLLEKLMHDTQDIISYFIYELNYGKDYEEGCIADQNEVVDLSTAERLYEWLLARHNDIMKHS